MFQHATITERDRKMTFAFDGPAIEDGDQFENWHERIKVTCTHNTRTKRYEAHVSWCKAAERANGFGVEQSAIFTDPYLLFMHSDPVGRFNQNKFNVFCSLVQHECISAVADNHDTRPVVELLRKAQSYALVKN